MNPPISPLHAKLREDFILCPNCGEFWEPKVSRTATEEPRGTRADYTIQKNCDKCHSEFLKELRGGK